MNYYYERLRYSLPQEPVRYFFSSSPRKILFITNLIIVVISLGLSGFSIYLSYLLYDRSFILGWVDWISLSFFGLCLASTCIIGMRGAHIVSLEMLLTYFWGIIVLVAPMMLATVASFNFYVYIHVWFTQNWAEPGFVKMRRLFCDPMVVSSTCAATLSNGVESVRNWCILHYNSTDCSDVTQAAIDKATTYGQRLTLAQGSICILVVILLAYCIYISTVIITSTVLTQSMNDIINYLMLLPICGSVGMAYYLWWVKTYSIEYSWIAEFYAALAVAQVVALPLGIIAGRLKSRVMLTVYVVLVFMIASSFAVAGTLGLIIAGFLPNKLNISSTAASDIACFKHLAGCSACHEPVGTNRCPQWSAKDIIQLVVADFQIAGTIAFISMLYLVGALIIASLVRHNLKNYKTDYV